MATLLRVCARAPSQQGLRCTKQFYPILSPSPLICKTFTPSPPHHNYSTLLRPALPSYSPKIPHRNSSTTPFPPIPSEGNTPPTIRSKVGKNLHLTPNHPLNYIKSKIHAHFRKTYPSSLSSSPSLFSFFDSFDPVVSVKQNFDDLLFPSDHVGRSPTDTYYLSPATLLRTHTSAHQSSLLREGHQAFLVTGDVYRRDEIDSSHYPVFHQMEGVRVFPLSTLPPAPSPIPSNHPPSFYYTDESYKSHPQIQFVAQDLKNTLEKLVKAVFGDVQTRWSDSYFPFTSPSFELEIFFKGAWLEVLGCGVIHPDIMRASGVKDSVGWAFGLGLERLAMVLFDIPDIRLFWSEDKRFHDQFRLPPSRHSPDGDVDFSSLKFQPFSKFPACYKDVAFWLPQEGYHENHFYELVRDIAGDLCESVKLVDKFVHPKTKRESHCYRINYRSMEKNLTNEEVNSLQADLAKSVVEKLGVTLR